MTKRDDATQQGSQTQTRSQTIPHPEEAAATRGSRGGSDGGSRGGGAGGNGGSRGRRGGRKPGWKGVLVGLAVAAGVLAAVFYDGSGGSDQITQQEITARQVDYDAFIESQSVSLSAVATDERDEAIAQMNISDEERGALKEDVDRGRAQLVWLTLWDTHSQDGDVVVVQSGGFQQTVPILHAKTRVAMPAPMTGVVNVQGVRDGGGGITIGILSGSTPVNVPFMREGEVIGVPVSVHW